MIRRRRSFVPSNPTDASLELRRVPSSIWAEIAHNWDSAMTGLGITHHHNGSNTAAILKLWQESPTLSKPHPASSHPAKAK